VEVGFLSTKSLIRNNVQSHCISMRCSCYRFVNSFPLYIVGYAILRSDFRCEYFSDCRMMLDKQYERSYTILNIDYWFFMNNSFLFRKATSL
jgi:hypothetical protein